MYQTQDFGEDFPFLWVNSEGQLLCVDRDEGYIFICKGLEMFDEVEKDIYWHVDHIATMPVEMVNRLFRL